MKLTCSIRRGAIAAALVLCPFIAHAEDDAWVCVSGIRTGDVWNEACRFSDNGVTRDVASGSGQVNDPFGASVSGSGLNPIGRGPWSSQQSADLSTGVVRSSLLFSADPSDMQPYLLGTYTTLFDTLTFSGQGSAVFLMRLTGRFLGGGHDLYPNTMDTSLDLVRVGAGYPDVLGRIHLAHGEEGQAVFQPGTTCGADWYQLGSVSCTVHSMNPQGVDITLRVTVGDIRDGDTFWFLSSLNVQAYSPRMGGTDFGNTARLGMELSPGLTLASSGSGVFLSQAAPVPEPGTWALLAAGLALVVNRARRRC